MLKSLFAASALLLAVGLTPTASGSQGRQDPAALVAAQREAMLRLSFMDGVWRGPAWTILPSGEKHNITQTERIGPFLDGSVKVIEGRGYDAGGKSRSTPSPRSLTTPPRARTRYTPTRRATSVISCSRPRPTATSGRYPPGR